MSTDESLRYPIGKYQPPDKISPEQRAEWINILGALPEKLKQAVSHLTETQLDTPYRPGGWTVRQVVHHLPDSHLNSYIRFRLALTENAPTIKPYDEAKWAELPDARTGPIGPSLLILEGLHGRWTALLRTFDDQTFARTLRHPEWGEIRIDWMLGLYAWHCGHHLAHITRLQNRA
jgi:hypothetical protein